MITTEVNNLCNIYYILKLITCILRNKKKSYIYNFNALMKKRASIGSIRERSASTG